MRLQCVPRVVVFGQLAFAESRVYFAMANAVYLRGVCLRLAALAFGHQVMLIHAAACNQRALAKRAGRKLNRRDVTQGFCTPKGAT